MRSNSRFCLLPSSLLQPEKLAAGEPSSLEAVEKLNTLDLEEIGGAERIDFNAPPLQLWHGDYWHFFIDLILESHFGVSSFEKIPGGCEFICHFQERDWLSLGWWNGQYPIRIRNGKKRFEMSKSLGRLATFARGAQRNRGDRGTYHHSVFSSICSLLSDSQ